MVDVCINWVKNLNKRVLTICILFVMALAVITTFALFSVKKVTIIDGANSKTLYVLNTNVKSAIESSGIKLNDGDEATHSYTDKITNNMCIGIRRAFPITVDLGGEISTQNTPVKTVGDFLSTKGITLNPLDIVTPSVDTIIFPQTMVSVKRITDDEVTEIEEIPFKITKINSQDLKEGEVKTIKEGVVGKKQTTYRIRTENGVTVKKMVLSSGVIQKPVTGQVMVGPKTTVPVSRGDGALRYKKIIIMNASAYDLSFASCGKRPGDRGYGITASGMKAGPGVVAVDRRVIPLGTRLYVQSMDGTNDYGYCIAGDTGGAIKGNRIDLFFNTRTECLNFGRRQVKVYVLE